MRKALKRQEMCMAIHRKRQVAGVVLMTLCFVLSASVYFVLAQPGITKVGDPSCGILAHAHNADCYELVLSCGDNGNVSGSHISACYNTVSNLVSRNQICGAQEILSCQCSEEPCECLIHAHGSGCFAEVYESVEVLNCNGSCEHPNHVHNEA